MLKKRGLTFLFAIFLMLCFLGAAAYAEDTADSPDGTQVDQAQTEQPADENIIKEASVGLIGWWPGDANYNDNVSGNNGIPVGGVGFGTGISGQAFALNGQDAYVMVPDSGDLNFGIGDFSVSLWVKFNTLKGEQVIIEKYVETFGNPSRTGWSLSKLDNNNIKFCANDNAVQMNPSSISINTWYNIVVTRSSNVFTLYWNSIGAASETFEVNLDSTSSVKMGHRGNPGDTPGSTDTRNFFLNGMIDEVKFYNGALSASEISTLYNSVPPDTGLSVIFGNVLMPDGGVLIPGDNYGANVILRAKGPDPYIAAMVVWLSGDGSYSLVGSIPSGDYELFAGAQGKYNPYTDSLPVDIHIEPGTAANIDLSLTNPSIKGKVFIPDGSLFCPGDESFVDVHLRTLDGKDLMWKNVNENGEYWLGGYIPAGDYLLVADALGSNNPFSSSIPQQIHMEAGQTLFQDIYLTNPAISGQILKPDGSIFLPDPGSWAEVRLRDTNGRDRMWTGVNSDGTYQFGGVPEGDYVIFVSSRGDGNPFADSMPVPVSVISGQTVTKDLSLTNPSLKGYILKPDGIIFTRSDNSWVDIVLRDSNGWDVCWTGINNDGSFKFSGDVPEGDYKIIAYDRGVNNPFAKSASVPVHLTSGSVMIQDISLTIPVVYGKVYKPDGTPFVPADESWVNVRLRTTGPKEWDVSDSGVNDDGSFRLGGSIPAGDYKLNASTDGKNNPYADSAPFDIRIEEGQTYNIDFSLTNPIVTGFIHKPDGSIFTPDQDSWVDVDIRYSNGNGFTWTYVYGDGHYRFSSYIPDGEYILVARSKGPLNPYADSPKVNITVSGGQPVTLDLTLTNPVITGKILKPDGSDFIPDNEYWSGARLRSMDGKTDITWFDLDRDCNYRLGGSIPTGDYLLVADAWGNNNPFTSSQPIQIHMEEGQTYYYDLYLTVPAISGKILKPDGSAYTPGPDSWADVCLRGMDGKDIMWTGVDGSGFYKFSGVQDGEYILFVHSRGTQNPYADSQRISITIAGGQPVIQDLTLTNPVITGRVLKPDGSEFIPGDQCWANARVMFMDEKEVTWFDLDGDCGFRLGGDIAPGDYFLAADAWGNNNPFTSSQFLQIHLEAGQTLVQDIYLTNPAISGQILKPDGSIFLPDPGSWADVCLRDMNGKDRMWTGVNNDGTYKFGGIPDGDYMIFVASRGDGNPFADSMPVPVSVISGQTATRDLSLTIPSLKGYLLKPDGSIFTRSDNSWADVVLRDSNGWDVSWTGINNDGSFKFSGDVPEGDYEIIAFDRGTNNPFARSAPVPVHLTPGSVTIQDISLTVPVVYGKVYKPDGAPFIPGDESWANVRLRTIGTMEWDIADSGVNDDGSFRLGGSIPAGDYKLYAFADGNNNPFANAIPIDVHIDEGQSYHIDISLTNPTVTGYIHKPDGSLFTPDKDSWVDVALRSSSYEKDFAWTGVQGDGCYKFNDYIPDGEYILFAHSRGKQNPFTDSPRVNITISGRQPVIQDLTLTTPVITGKILKPDGSEFIPDNEYWAGARLRDMSGKDVTWFDLDGDCNFRLGGNIAPGDYNLVADAWGNNNPYTSSQPVQIYLEAGQTIYQDLFLTVPVVMGKVLKPDGSVFIPDNDSWADVCIRDMNGKDIMWTGVDGSGFYRFGGTIPDGDYRLAAYDRGRNNPFAKSSSVDIHYSAGMTIEKDLTLTNPSVKGTVLAPDGSPFMQGQDAWAYIILRTTGPEEMDVFDTGIYDGGVFRVGGVPDGDYRLFAYTDGRDNPYCGSKPLDVQVENGNVKSIEISLTMPILSGYILTPAGDPFIPGEDSDAGVAINTVGPNGEEYGRGWSPVSNNGRYKFGWEIPEGDYVLHAYVWGSNNGYVNSAPLNVHVNPASSASQDIYLTNPIITGKILKPDGTVFTVDPGWEIWFKFILTLPDGKRISEGAVYPDGTYRIGGSVNAGDYMLKVECGGKDIPYTGSIPVSVHIPEGQTYSVDLTLTEPMAEGRLLNPKGELFDPGPDSGFRILLTDVNDINKIFKDVDVYSDGSFRLGGDIKDGDYNLVADTANVDPNRYDYTNSLPVKVSLKSGNKIIQDMKLTNPSVEGNILKPDGSTFDPGENSGIWLFLKSPDGKEYGSAWVGSGSKGYFRFAGNVPQGDYKIFAVTAWSGSQYTDPVAVPVHITPGETVTCAVKLTNPSIKGRLLTPEGKKVSPKEDSFYYIALFDIYNKNICVARTSVGGGDYQLGGYIPSGDYKLYVFAMGAGNPYEDSAPVVIHVKKGTRLNQDIRLSKPLLKGQVLTPDGKTYLQEAGMMTFAALSRDSNLTEADWKNISNWEYDFWRLNSNPWLTSTQIANVYANGTFSFGGNIAPGIYNLFVHVDPRSAFKDSTPVKVTIAAGKLTNVNVRLNARSSDASVRSVVYKVDNSALVISNVPNDAPLDVFCKNLTPAPGAKYMVLLSDGITEVTSGCIKTGMKVKVVAEDGKTTRIYTIKTNPYIEKEIKSFTVRVETRNAVTGTITYIICNGVIDKLNHTVTFKVPNGVSVNSLKPVITVSPNTTINPPSGAAVNFSSPVIYQIRDNYGGVQEWKVICIVEAAVNVKR